MITYAQNFEDVMLARLFAEKDAGFYVDIGAGDPTHLSVTRHFYERGWRGVNVEPLRANWERFVRERPRDINLNVAIAGSPGRRDFCEVVDNDALSSLDTGRIGELAASGARTRHYEVECVIGESLFEQFQDEVDFLKIDVEGSEEEVLRSIDLVRHRPKVLVIEATTAPFPGWSHWAPQGEARWESWEPHVLQSGYAFAYFDGLNRFYLRDDLRHLCARLSIPPGVFDFIVPDLQEALNSDRRQSDAAFVAHLHEKETMIQSLKADVERCIGQWALSDRAQQEKEAVIEGLQRSLDALASQRESIPQALAESADVPDSEATRQYRDLLKALEDKEAVIQELDAAVRAFRSTYGVLQYFIPPGNLARAVAWMAGIPRRTLAPRLGVLIQHPPREMSLPAHYARPVKLAHAPGISIVTPSFQQAEFIERTIRSVLEQSYPKIEYFVQDGGSQDGTREILERYADRLTGWDARPDGGQAEAINLGFARTKGEIMGWINSDDILLPGALAAIGDFFHRHPDIDVVYGHRILVDENDRQIGRWVMPSHDDEVLSWADYIPQETLFWRRRIWEKVDARVDESFRFALDWDLLVRFRGAGARFARLPRFIGGFRIHSQQKTSAAISDIGFKEMDRIRERVLGRVPSRVEVRNAVAPYLMRHVVSDLLLRIRERFGGAA